VLQAENPAAGAAAAALAAPVLIARAGVGDPWAEGEASLLAAHPATIIEALSSAARAAGAGRVVLCLGGAAKREQEGIRREAERLAGQGLLDGPQGVLEIEVRESPEPLVCAEKSAFVAALAGSRPVPALAPEAELSLEGHPAVVVEVRDLAREAGLPADLFTLDGEVASTGVVEAPAGATLREIIFDLGGGLPAGVELQGVRVGGPTGAFLPAALLDTPATDEALEALGARLGAGSLVVASTGACAVDLTHASLEVLAQENCGKCVVCREGSMQMAEMVGDIAGGQGKPGDIDLLLELARALSVLGKCDWGRSGANPVLSAVGSFHDEFEAHLAGRCPSGVCALGLP
jgi:NADH:ubiquinone oxidoreductase subunit F (NADH-binding)